MQKTKSVARTDIRFRAAYNQTLTSLAELAPGASLPSELKLAEELKVSRTVVRSVLQRLVASGIVQLEGRAKPLLRATTSADFLPEPDEYASLSELEGRFLDWVLRFDVPAETPLNVAQLAKQFSVPPHLLQEFLASLSHFGLVERRQRGGWRLLGFTLDYAMELSDLRMLLEVNAVRAACALPEDHPLWAALEDLDQRHLHLLSRIDTDFRDFSRLDEKFHSTLNSVVKNRFVSHFQRVISLIFHYHYQWDKSFQRDRNRAAIGEHRLIIAAVRERDADQAQAAMQAHLATSKKTLISSFRVNRLG
jgi:DNA-binding GntR family transcriptional regulator